MLAATVAKTVAREGGKKCRETCVKPCITHQEVNWKPSLYQSSKSMGDKICLTLGKKGSVLEQYFNMRGTFLLVKTAVLMLT